MAKKTVVSVELLCSRCRQKVMALISRLEGITSIVLDPSKNTVTVIGEADPVRIIRKVRKFRKTATIVSIGPPKEEKKDEKKDVVCYPSSACKRCDVWYVVAEDTYTHYCSIISPQSKPCGNILSYRTHITSLSSVIYTEIFDFFRYFFFSKEISLSKTQEKPEHLKQKKPKKCGLLRKRQYLPPKQSSPVAASLATSAVLLRTVANDLIPDAVQDFFFTRLRKLSSRFSSDLTVVIDELDGYVVNQLFGAVSVYLGSTLSSSTRRIKVIKTEKEEELAVKIDKNQELVDSFDGVEFKWILISLQNETAVSVFSRKGDPHDVVAEVRRYELRFHKKHREMVLNRYLPYVLERAKRIKEEKKSVKLHTVDYNGSDYWGGINLDHPATFNTIAMDSETKKALINDLNRFMARKEYYRRVGKAWKRGYLLYGPPGTGKSSLVAAMANYLKFDVYDLDLKEIQCNSDLRRLLIGTGNRSILVIEDIDCSIELQNRSLEDESDCVMDDKITLSGLLNFIDGLWSSCGDERIVVFTTNHKDKLDPALLRPGRMDLHLHMSYCDFSGFKVLAKNYLEIKEHPLFEKVEELLKKVMATPAEVSGELMKSDDADLALQGLIKFLQTKEVQS